MGSLSLGPPRPPQGDEGWEPARGGHSTEAGPWEGWPEPPQAWDSRLSPTPPVHSASYHRPGLPHEQVGWNLMAPPQLPGNAPVPATEPKQSGFSAGEVPPPPPPTAGAPLTQYWRTRAARSSGERMGSAPGLLTPQPAGDASTVLPPCPPSASRAQKNLSDLLRRFWA